ncbi:cupin [Caballeronia hypogeia]|uniref:Cupin n=1 Tax=Caballeronia hypogeia TaxID=1777140 RepID=A0A158CZ13_9BURK|nr:cupin domain-containing protein [Caballeronia hypogeia]SAK87604.1 cupin [Caballeronia hypogeia]
MKDNVSNLVILDAASVEPKINAPFFAGTVQGDPQTRTWVNEGSREQGFLAGIWEATEGTFAMDYPVWEFCHIIAGRCIIREEGREAVELKAGDGFVCRKGLKGTWEVVETMTKHFVVRI